MGRCDIIFFLIYNKNDGFAGYFNDCLEVLAFRRVLVKLLHAIIVPLSPKPLKSKSDIVCCRNDYSRGARQSVSIRHAGETIARQVSFCHIPAKTSSRARLLDPNALAFEKKVLATKSTKGTKQWLLNFTRVRRKSFAISGIYAASPRRRAIACSPSRSVAECGVTMPHHVFSPRKRAAAVGFNLCTRDAWPLCRPLARAWAPGRASPVFRCAARGATRYRPPSRAKEKVGFQVELLLQQALPPG